MTNELIENRNRIAQQLERNRERERELPEEIEARLDEMASLRADGGNDERCSQLRDEVVALRLESQELPRVGRKIEERLQRAQVEVDRVRMTQVRREASEATQRQRDAAVAFLEASEAADDARRRDRALFSAATGRLMRATGRNHRAGLAEVKRELCDAAGPDPLDGIDAPWFRAAIEAARELLRYSRTPASDSTAEQAPNDYESATAALREQVEVDGA